MEQQLQQPFDKKEFRVASLLGAGAGLLAIPVLRNLLILPAGAGWFALPVASLMLATSAGYLVASFLSSRLPVIMQIVKFGIVGGFNTMFDFGILNALIFLTGRGDKGLMFSAFKATSFTIVVISSYFLNKHWTFRMREETSSRSSFLPFIAVNIIGLGINVGISSLLVNYVGGPAGITSIQWANIGTAASVLISLVWNFTGMKFFVFKK